MRTLAFVCLTASGHVHAVRGPGEQGHIRSESHDDGAAKVLWGDDAATNLDQGCTAAGVHAADLSKHHCRPFECIAGTKHYGLQQVRRREIYDWSNDDFKIFGEALNMVKKRSHPHKGHAGIQFPWDKTTTEAPVVTGPPGYDDFALMHHHSQNAHNNPNFLPFHRWFLLYIEQQMQHAAVNCSIVLPYWNWAMDAHRIDKAAPFTSERFGTLKEGCVDDGFAAGWHWTSMEGHDACLRRKPTEGLNGVLPDWAEVTSELLKYPSFGGLHSLVEDTWHNPLHCLIGGQMCSMDSPVDPSFFLHHAQIDRMWYFWQRNLPHMEQDCSGCSHWSITGTDFDTENPMNAKEWASKFDEKLQCYPVPANDPQWCISYEEEHRLPEILKEEQ